MTTPNAAVQDITALLMARRNSKIASVKRASPGDAADDGTEKTKTGDQFATNIENASATRAAAVGNVEENKVGDSVEHSKSTLNVAGAATDGSTGAQVDSAGVAGGKGSMPEAAPGSNAKVSADLVAGLRKVASDLEAERAVKIASMTRFDKFLASAVKADAELVKVAADAGMDDAAMADQAKQDIIKQIESGQLSEEDAQKILQEAVQSGAISQEEMQQALAELQAMQGQGGAPAPEAAGAAPAPEEQVQDPALEAKVANVHVDPSHPQYAEKLEALYGDAIHAGADLCLKVAHVLGYTKRAEDVAAKAEEKAEALTKSNEEPKGDEKAAVEAAAKELGIDAKVASDLLAAPVDYNRLSPVDRIKADIAARMTFAGK